jgi:hypothetical protein
MTTDASGKDANSNEGWRATCKAFGTDQRIVGNNVWNNHNLSSTNCMNDNRLIGYLCGSNRIAGISGIIGLNPSSFVGGLPVGAVFATLAYKPNESADVSITRALTRKLTGNETLPSLTVLHNMTPTLKALGIRQGDYIFMPGGSAVSVEAQPAIQGATSKESRERSKALPRRRILCTNSKNPR